VVHFSARLRRALALAAGAATGLVLALVLGVFAEVARVSLFGFPEAPVVTATDGVAPSRKAMLLAMVIADAMNIGALASVVLIPAGAILAWRIDGKRR
jgi:hypothetical protein